MVSLLLDLRMMAEAGLGEPGQLPWGLGLPTKIEPVQNATAGTHSQPVETLKLKQLKTEPGDDAPCPFSNGILAQSIVTPVRMVCPWDAVAVRKFACVRTNLARFTVCFSVLLKTHSVSMAGKKTFPWHASLAVCGATLSLKALELSHPR